MITIIKIKCIKFFSSIKSVSFCLTLSVFLLLSLNEARAQSGKTLVLADEYFKAGEYLTAAGLYKQYLHPVQKEKPFTNFPLQSRKSSGSSAGYTNKTDIIFKQAESYRLANYFPEAINLYKHCFETDSVKYLNCLYYLAVCERSLGDYAAAELNLQYLSNQKISEDLRQFAEKERATLAFIRAELARPDSVLFRVNKIDNTAAQGAWTAFTNDNNSYLFTAVQRDSVQSGSNPFHNRIFTGKLNNGRVENIESLVIEGMDPAFSQGAATMKPDGSVIYFTQWQQSGGKLVSSIYYATKKGNHWSKAMPLRLVNQQGHNSKQPFCSADGQYLFFASDRKGSAGNFDIWYCTFNSDGSLGSPVNAGAAINTAANEQAPFYHSTSSTLVFSSERSAGMGGYDLFQSKGRETSWSAVENLGSPVNSPRDDIYFFSAPGGELLANALVGSDRGSECCSGIYNIAKSSKDRFITGLVRDCETNQPMEGAEVIVEDATGDRMTGLTNAEGKYVFTANGKNTDSRISVMKASYENKTSTLTIDSTIENLLTETMSIAQICLDKKKQEIIVNNVIPVYFDFDRSELTESGKLQLDSIYNVMLADETVALQISGYTDGQGSEIYNKILSDKRAKTCAGYLIKKGIAASRMTFESFGSCCPVQMEQINGRDNKDGRALNRRALINIIRK